MARTVMSFTDRISRAALRIAILVGCAAGLAGCIYPEEPLSPDLGRALHEDLVAQIANPEATYGPPPPADGARSGLAMERYHTGKVIKPVPAAASDIGVHLTGANGQQ